MSVTPFEVSDIELAKYPEDIQEIMRGIMATSQSRWAYWTSYDHSEVKDGRAVHYDKEGRIMCDTPASAWFGLSYASWLTLPRVSLQEMPLDWQARFFAMIEEAEDKFGLRCPEGISVVRKDGKNRFVNNDHWNNYRRGTVAEAVAKDEALNLEYN